MVLTLSGMALATGSSQRYSSEKPAASAVPLTKCRLPIRFFVQSCPIELGRKSQFSVAERLSYVGESLRDQMTRHTPRKELANRSFPTILNEIELVGWTSH